MELTDILSKTKPIVCEQCGCQTFTEGNGKQIPSNNKPVKCREFSLVSRRKIKESNSNNNRTKLLILYSY